MNNRRRNLRKAMLNTYVEGRVWKVGFLSCTLEPMELDDIRMYISLSTLSNMSAPFYYNLARGNYIFALLASDRKEKIRLEQMSRSVHEAEGSFVKAETPLERRMRLVRENSLYGVDGLTEQELLSKKG
jgi:hypothetical protein